MRRTVGPIATLVASCVVAVVSPVLADEAGAADASPRGAAPSDAGDAVCGDAGSLACPAYVRYVNEKFAFSVDVPTFLVRRGADADGRGQPFDYRAGGKRISVRAWAMYNAPVMTVDQLFADWCRRGKNTFKAVAGNTWIVRGTENGRSFYMRSMLSDGIITTIEATYDPAYADDFEPVLARMGATLMPIPGHGVRARGPHGAP
jgi:hypothetical protein